MKKKDIFWGIVCITLAVLVIISEMGWIQGIGFWTVAFTVLFGASLVKGIIKIDFTQILFSVAFLCIVWDDVLRITQLTPWPVLLAALLGSVGLNKLFGKDEGEYEKKYYESYEYKKDGKTTVEQDNSENVKCSVSFGSVVKYINSEDLKTVHISADFASASIYLDNAAVPSGEVVVKVHSSFSGIQIFVPRDWNVVNKVDCSFSGIKEENSKTGVNAVNVVLVGSVNFGGVTVKYI